MYFLVSIGNKYLVFSFCVFNNYLLKKKELEEKNYKFLYNLIPKYTYN